MRVSRALQPHGERLRRRKLILAVLLAAAGWLALGATAHAGQATEEPTEETDGAAPTGAEVGEEGGEGGESVPAEEQEEAIHHAEEIAEANGAEHADVECIPILVEGGSVDECHEAPNPILPETNEIIWGVASFFVLFLLLRKFAWPGLKAGLEGRTDRIQTDLNAAESAKSDAEQVLNDYRAQVASAKAEAGQIIEEARQQADALKRDQEGRLQTELAEMRARAAADVESAKAQALADLRHDVGELAIGAAEAIVRHNLDPETQRQLVDRYIDQVATRGQN